MEDKLLTTLVGFGSGFYIAYLLFRTTGYCCDPSYHNCGVCTEWGLVGLIGFFIGIGIAIFVALWSAMTADVLIPRYHTIKTEEHEIVALKMSSSVSGTFFLGSGAIETKPVYFYYIKTNGQFQLQYVSAMESKIVEDNNAKPSIATWEYKWREDTLSVLLRIFIIPTDGNKNYKITIPEGSIASIFQPL